MKKQNKNAEDFNSMLTDFEKILKEVTSRSKSNKFEKMINNSLNPSQKIKDAQNRIDNILNKIANDLKIKIGGQAITNGKINYITDGNGHKIDLSKVKKEYINELNKAIKIAYP